MNKQSHNHDALGAMMLGAVGIVYGDIGTSPLYTMKEVFGSGLAANSANIYGILSMIFWALMITVSIKYVLLITRADNRGEGGVLALSSLAQRGLSPRAGTVVLMLGMLGMALFVGDSLITPAMSVLSAMEGINVIAPKLGSYIIPLTIGILIALFALQRKGTDLMGKVFGPIMLTWFSILGLLGFLKILNDPKILSALIPSYAVGFILNHGTASFFILGNVVLAITGGEALYADMGHFGRPAIKYSWTFFVLPCLTLNYFGQGSLILANSKSISNPFYLLAPGWAIWPMILLAALATIIASQAVISGAFSLTQQAVTLGYIPRREIRHTSDRMQGQVYVPNTNWILMIGVLLLVLGFRSSANLAGAYGFSVMGVMAINCILAYVVSRNIWKWGKIKARFIFGPLMFMDILFLLSSCLKIPDGGWLPLMVAIAVFGVMWIWRKGKNLLMAKLNEESMGVDLFLRSQLKRFEKRVPGTAIFLTGNTDVVPLMLLHNIKHNKVLHERVILMHVKFEDVPYKKITNRAEVAALGDGFYKVILHFGFMEKPDVPRALELLQMHEIYIDIMDTTFFLGRETIVAANNSSLNRLEQVIFIALTKTAAGATDFFCLPPNRMMALGSQVEL